MKNIPYEFQPLAGRKTPDLSSINAQGCLFKNKLGQVTQHRKHKHSPEQRRNGKEYDTNSPGNYGEHRI
jgi:hypothetical protein